MYKELKSEVKGLEVLAAEGLLMDHGFEIVTSKVNRVTNQHYIFALDKYGYSEHFYL